MKLTEKRVFPSVITNRFELLPAGSVFDFDGEIFILPLWDSPSSRDCAVKLYDGALRHFLSETIVQPLDAELVYSRRLVP